MSSSPVASWGRALTRPAVAGRYPWKYGLVLGLGFFGISAIGPIYNTYVPLLLSDFGLSATLVGFVMTWDNWLNLVLPAAAGALSDRTWTRWGRRKPWILIPAPFIILLYPFIALAPTLAVLLPLLLLVNIAISTVRAPGLALLGDMFAPQERSKASGIINLVGGLGIVTALVVSGFAYRIGPATPFVVGSLVMLGSMLIFGFAVHERKEWGERHDRMPLSMAALRRARRGRIANVLLLFLVILFSFSAFNILETWISSYARAALGLDEARIPLVVAVFAISLLIGAVPSGFFGARVGQKRAIALGMLLMLIVLASGIFVNATMPLLLVLIPAGLGWALVIINLFPLIYAVGGDGLAGTFTGLYYTVTSAAAIAGPQLVGFLLDATGQDWRVMWATASVSMLVGFVLLFGVRQK
ncbi:MAG: MFS transporter [Caldilineales bacterium]|nr:MFS transporter [Caldilineales bacterium]